MSSAASKIASQTPHSQHYYYHYHNLHHHHHNPPPPRAQEHYEPIHGYLALAVCAVGTLFNLINILVLTHKDMRRNPINLILTGIAVADVLVMLEYVPFAVHMYLLKYQGSR